MTGLLPIRGGASRADGLSIDLKLHTLGAISRGFLNAESLLLLQALEGVVDQAFADVQPCTFAPGVALIQEGEVPDGLLLVSSGVVQANLEGLSEQEGPLLGPGSVLGDISFL